MYKALIIDDEKPVRQVIAALGRWHTFGIDPPAFACDGLAGLQAMRELHPQIVFLDMEMPEMDGAAFLKAAAAEFPDAKYIVVSGYDDFAYTKIAIQYHVLDYLLKPVVEEELLAVLQHAVEQLNAAGGAPADPASPCKLTNAELVEEIRQYLESHYAQEINLDMFSRKYFFSKEYLSRIYKHATGVGIYEYTLKLRMTRARELLADPDLRIQDIAERLGYSNSNYFSKAFKNYYDYAPTAARDRE